MFITLTRMAKMTLLRSYRVQSMGMTEAGIDGGLFRDIYVALGDPLDGGSWAIRVHYKPFVRWIWLGAIFMAIGGILAMLDKRYRVTDRKKAAIIDNKNIDSVNINTKPISELS